jgi:Flp pilus assembly protein TadB
VRAAIVVGVLIFLAEVLWGMSNRTERRLIQRRTKNFFERPPRSRDRPTNWPLSHFHPRYEKWLKQANSKRSARKLEQQQWLLGVVAIVVVRVLTGNLVAALILGTIAFLYPVFQIRAQAKGVARSTEAEMRSFILLLKIYVRAGVGNLQALRLAEKHLKGQLRRIVHDTQALMGQMTFEEAMSITAKQSPSEQLEVVASALKQGAKHGSEITETLNQSIIELNHEDALRLDKKQRSAKMGVYLKFFLFFVSPLILDVMLFAWGMMSNAAHQM